VPADEPGVLPLLRAELADLGLEIIELPYANEPPHPNENSASSQQGVAEFRIAIRQSSVEVWIYDRKTNDVTMHEVFAHVDGSPVDARTAVLRAVELLRWRLRDVEPRPRATPSIRPNHLPQTSPAPLARQKEWFVAFTPYALYSPGGTNPGPGVGFDLTWKPQRVGVRVSGGTLFEPNVLSLPEGRAEVTPRFIGLETVLFPSSSSPRLSYDMGAGISIVSIRLRGTTDQPIQSHSDSLLTAAPLLKLRAKYAFGGSVSFLMDATAMVPLRWDIIRIDEREVGRYGRTLLMLGLGLQVSLQ
jgi:hypothetical protein